MPTSEGVDLTAAHFKHGDVNYCQITVVPPEGSTTTNLSLVALMDVSGSMGAAATVDRGGTQVDVGFSVLDITKHAMKTVIETMKDGDKLSIVSFSNFATVVSPLLPMSESNKETAKQRVNEQYPSGCTNMWDALEKALDVLEEAGRQGQLGNSIPSILFFTDGMPSEHLLPQNGIMGSLKARMEKITQFKPTIHTFGFGYDLDTPLMVDIAHEGDGAFSFIPDSGFVGTVLVHAVANLATCVGGHAVLNLTFQEGASLKKVIGYPATATADGASVSIDSVHFGQNKSVVVALEGSDSAQAPVKAKLTYVNAAGASQSLEAVAQTMTVPDVNKFKQELLRVEFTELLRQILQDGSDISRSTSAVNTFLEKWGSSKEEGVFEDCEGQVKIAVSRADYYKRWGCNYIASLMMAHRQQRCNNFKDKGVANYGGELFEQCRDTADDIFTSMPPPVPSRRPAATADSKPDPSNFSMSNFNDADNPCFDGEALVRLGDGTERRCREVRKGDWVAAAGGAAARVLCVVKTECAGGVQQLVHLPSGLRVTPWHPVRAPGAASWAFPASLAAPQPTQCEAVYSFVLEAQHVMTIQGMECVALAHGFQDPVAQHPYYGSHQVLADLQALPGFPEGLLHFRSGPVRRAADGKVVGFDANRLQVVRSDAN